MSDALHEGGAADMAAPSAPEGLQIGRVLETGPLGAYVRFGDRRIRIEYILLVAIALLAFSLLAAFLAYDIGWGDVERWGYGGLFLVSLLRAASVLLPMPGSGLAFAAGGFLSPVWGIPAPILVGVVAGLAESIGEFTGYGAGMSGTRMLDRRRIYQRIRGWIQKRAFITMFVMSLTPSPVFDIAGIAAGATRVPIRVFYPAILLGKTTRAIMLATAGFYGIGLLEKIF